MSEPIKMSFSQQLAENKRKREKFEEFKETLKLAVEEDQKIVMGKAMIPLIIEQLEAMELRYCEMVAMHSNNLVTMGSALICLENKDIDGAESWLFEMTDGCDAHHWQLFDDAEKYYGEMHLPFPSSQEQHRENIVAQGEKLDALEPKWAYCQKYANLLKSTDLPRSLRHQERADRLRDAIKPEDKQS